MLRRYLFGGFVASCVAAARVLPAAEPPVEGAPVNWQLPTLGGLQYWADEQLCGPYRIQRNVTTGHYRLLDASEERLAWGTYAQCNAKLGEVCKLAPPRAFTKRVVLVLHGMARTRNSMDDLSAYLRKHGTDDVLQIGYPSTREDIPTHARSLEKIIERLDGVEEVDVVAYSMGNLVTRYWLGNLAAEQKGDATATVAPKKPLPRLRRYVMLGPPNHGAQRANLWAQSTVGRELFNIVVGDGGQQLGPRFHEIKDHLATPACEFGIVAGGKGDGKGWHDGIPGDDDGTVGVEEAKLAGASDFVVIPVRHMSLLTDDRSLKMVASFLKDGYFQSAEARNPVTGQ
jgi:pimeloyl-ACP methyl ester carboxylesterase